MNHLPKLGFYLVVVSFFFFFQITNRVYADGSATAAQKNLTDAIANQARAAKEEADAHTKLKEIEKKYNEANAEGKKGLQKEYDQAKIDYGKAALSLKDANSELAAAQGAVASTQQGGCSGQGGEGGGGMPPPQQPQQQQGGDQKKDKDSAQQNNQQQQQQQNDQQAQQKTDSNKDTKEEDKSSELMKQLVDLNSAPANEKTASVKVSREAADQIVADINKATDAQMEQLNKRIQSTK